jgi:hypothetical protein
MANRAMGMPGEPFEKLTAHQALRGDVQQIQVAV